MVNAWRMTTAAGVIAIAGVDYILFTQLAKWLGVNWAPALICLAIGVVALFVWGMLQLAVMPGSLDEEYEAMMWAPPQSPEVTRHNRLVTWVWRPLAVLALASLLALLLVAFYYWPVQFIFGVLLLALAVKKVVIPLFKEIWGLVEEMDDPEKRFT
ncbi:MAG TPA: hypothetical protein VHP58_02845 [Alphaproteobacteria bacterium]|nr:hypothetical protein [Alphaproteobacteria bacterium]